MFVHPAHRPGSETDVLGRRIAATVLDTGVVFVLYYALLLVVSGAIRFGVGRAIDFFNYITWFVVSVFGFTPLLSLHGESWVWFLTATLTWAGYAAICETLRGQTLGKALVGIVVVRDDGGRCGPLQAVVRNLFLVVDGLLYYFVGLMILSFSSDRQRLGDHLAGTIVVGVRGRR